MWDRTSATVLPSFIKREEEFITSYDDDDDFICTNKQLLVRVHRTVNFLGYPPPAAELALEPLTTENIRRSATADRVRAFART